MKRYGKIEIRRWCGVCFSFLIFAFLHCTLCLAQPKREFRGAWIQCVNGQYLGKTPQQLRSMLSEQLDVLHGAGINAILFQVRAEGDALYRSDLEPWSRYLTGTQGKAPDDGWDPLAWMVEECHKRSMECHAWINPYHDKTAGTKEVAVNHVAATHPERLFQYGDLLIFNPALEINRQYTCMVIEDILKRYDVDGLHMDDYFYPYPTAGQSIPDEANFRADPRGFTSIADWRRDNVNILIQEIHDLVRRVKPWVKFGISPFGIYRNSPDGKNSKEGSATRGTQNYDDLYADIVLWQEREWVDYLIPQIYWNIGYAVADYEVLVHWWNDYCGHRPLYIGQDVERTVKEADPKNPQVHQMISKYALQRSLPNVQGSCQWYAAAVVNNPGNYRTMLEQEYHKRPALQPLMPWIDKKAPKKVGKLKIQIVAPQASVVNGIYLAWKEPKAKKELDKATRYAVYRFAPGEKPTLTPDDASHLVAIVSEPRYLLQGNQTGCTFVVTALDRMQNESKGVKVKL